MVSGNAMMCFPGISEDFNNQIFAAPRGSKTNSQGGYLDFEIGCVFLPPVLLGQNHSNYVPVAPNTNKKGLNISQHLAFRSPKAYVTGWFFPR